MKIKYLRESQIETAAFNLLVAYGQKYGEISKPPIPVDAILESHLCLNFSFDDLPKLFNKPDVLGATWVKKRKICIDQSLDPTEHPSAEGRFRFTVAHELGHWILHKSQIEEVSGGLFETDTKPSIVCRTQSAKEPIEWQADAFAGFLLMPKELVHNTWKNIFGSLEPYIAVNEIADLSARWGLAEDSHPTVKVTKKLAQIFNVSGQSMQIRLIGLGLVLTKQPEKGLF
ncbi:MAG: hypothetical protein A2Y13_05290 [Planctomycetes bacterium GWC2_45_44]|nr:MAG: hypothetical protein A2Y13_05290 [Planctomycetes bacterium GWC2_45_44]